jgi:DNA-binding transcriptional LysR family regulator
MQAFIKAVETGSLAEAGRRLDVSAPMMTRYLDYLEKRVGARLINRSTMRLVNDTSMPIMECCRRNSTISGAR